MKQTVRKKIDRLQTLLVHAKEFSEPLDYFLDEIASDQEFMNGCQPLNNPSIIAIMLGVTEHINRAAGGGEDKKADKPVLQINKKFKLAHGGCGIDGRFAILFYFRELDMGIVGLPAAQDPELVIFARFTGHGIELPTGAITTFDHSGYKH